MAKTKEKAGSLKAETPKDWAGEYVAMTILMKPGTNGLWVLRRISIKDGEILSIEDAPEDLKEIQVAKMDQEISR
jgi:hypothetical protein